MGHLEITFPGGMRVDAQNEQFHIQTDQPIDEGGTGTAPSPFTLFLAGLACCSGAYVQGFCEARDIPLDGLKLIQRVEWNEKKTHCNKVEMDIVLPPQFPAKYEKAVVRVANMCAVKKAIIDPPEMVLNTVRHEPVAE